MTKGAWAEAGRHAQKLTTLTKREREREKKNHKELCDCAHLLGHGRTINKIHRAEMILNQESLIHLYIVYPIRQSVRPSVRLSVYQ